MLPVEGLCMPLQLNSPISILRNTFEGNSATCGGAVSIESNYDPAILIDRNTFTDNEAEMGGAVYIDTGRFCSMSISNNTFTDNEANRGGAIYADWTKISSLNHNTFFGMLRTTMEVRYI
jgi:predicted outer membrane repeat protein